MGMDVGGVSNAWTLSPADYAEAQGQTPPTVFDAIDDLRKAEVEASADESDLAVLNKALRGEAELTQVSQQIFAASEALAEQKRANAEAQEEVSRSYR